MAEGWEVVADLNIMPILTDALEGDTAALSDERFGQYMRLLVRWWRDGCKPLTKDGLCEISGLAPRDLDKLMRFLTETPDGFIQKRLFSTFKKQAGYVEKGRARAEKRWASDAQNDGNGMRKPMHEAMHEAVHDRMHDGCKIDGILTPNSKDVDAKEASTSSAHSAPDDPIPDVPRGTKPRGTRLASDWKPPPEFIAWAVEHEHLTEEEAFREADQFRDYWLARSGREAAKLDWFATWRNRVRDVAGRIRAGRGARDGGRRTLDAIAGGIFDARTRA